MVFLPREARETPKVTASHLTTIGTLLPYLWPKGETELRARVLIAIVLLVLAKVANVYVPFLYKGMVDALSGKAGPEITIPIGLLVG
jgi:ATP-binding cassette subfamily B protein